MPRHPPATATARSPARSPAPVRRREWLLLAVALGLVAALAVRPSIRGNDGVGHYVYLASMLRGGDWDFRDEYQAFDEMRRYPFRFADLPVSAETGLPSNRYGIGAALLWAPFVLPVHGWLRATHPDAADALTRPYECAVGIATAFWGSLALLLLYGRLRRDVDPWIAGGVVAGLLFATPLGFYLYAHGSMAHGASFFGSTLALMAFESLWDRPTWRRMVLVGIAAGLLAMIRMQDATWSMLLIAAGWVRWVQAVHHEPAFRNGWGRVAGPLALVVAAAATFAPQLAVWKVLYGSWWSGPEPYLDHSAGSFSPWPRHWFQAWFSGRHGALAWHPLLAVGIVGLIGLVRRPNASRPAAALGLLGFVATSWLVGSWSMWWAGASFGNRFFISCLPWLALGMARVAAWRTHSRWRRACGAGLALLVVWNAGLLYQYAVPLIPREDPVEWRRIVRQTIIDVPADLWRRLRSR